MKQIRILLTTIALLIATTTYAGIEPTSGRYIESNTDLSIKVIGGQITWARDYRDRQWRFNRAWESLILTHDIGSGNVESIQRANDPYKKLDSAGTVFKYGKRSTIRKQADGSWLWKDRDGNSTSYDANGKTLRMDSKGGAFITLMYNDDNKLSGAKDVNGTQVLWIEYDLISGKVSKAKDYGNREVLYTWQAVNNTTSPIRYKLTNVKDARGYDWQYAYAGAVARDGRVDINSRIDPEGRVVAVAYGGSGRASGVTNALGHITNYTFDYIKSRKEFYLKTSYPGGRVTETWYESDGEVKRRDINGINIITITEDLRKDIETDTFGRVTIKEEDEFRNLLKTTYPDGTSTSTTYDVANSNVLTQTDERGTITKYEYWLNGRLKKMIEALGTTVERSTEYTYDSFGQMLTKTQVGDAVTATAITQYFFDGFGNVSKIIDAELNERLFTSYDSQGNNLIMIDGRGNPWTYGYDALGNQISDKNPLNEETTNTYDKVENLVKTTYPDANFIQFEYDNQNRIVKRIDELSYFTTITYDHAGNRIAETDNAGRTTQYRYDILGRLTEIEDPIANVTKINFPSINQVENSGNIYQSIRNDYPSFSRVYKYNLKGQIIEQIESYRLSNTENKQKITKYILDELGNKVEIIDSESNSNKAIFNELNYVIKRIGQSNKETTYSYDNRGNIIQLKNALNHSTTYEYNKINRKNKETQPLGQENLYFYNSNGSLREFIDAKFQKTVHLYDEANKKESSQYYKQNLSLEKTVGYQYNKRGMLISYTDGVTQGAFTYDSSMQKISENIIYGSESFSFNYTYHKDGKIASYQGIDEVKYDFHYNGLSIINNIVIPNEGNISYSNFEWYNPTTISYPGGIQRLESFDGIQNIEKVLVKDSTEQSIYDYSISRSDVGNILKIQSSLGEYNYQYDNSYRIKESSYPTISSELYSYDAIGNRKSSLSSNQFTWTYNSNGFLLSTGLNQYTYDANGNQVNKLDSNGQVIIEYLHNIENRLSEIKNASGQTVATYYYDPFGRRLSKTLFNSDLSNSIIYYHYNDIGLSAEINGNQITSYLFSPNGYWSTYPILKKVNNNYYYYQNNHLGMPQLIHSKLGTIVNKKGYADFGDFQETIVVIEDSFIFPGQYKDDESGLNYNFNRYYDPKIGRYIRPDPVYQNDNQKYSYASQNPQLYFDPLGLFKIDPSCKNCKFKDKWDEAQKACENNSNNMSRANYGAGRLKECVLEYCKSALIKCQNGNTGDCEGNAGFTRGYGKFTICVDNNSPSDLNDTVTHEVCHLCDPDNTIRHGNDRNNRYDRANRRWKGVGCPL